MQLRTTIVATKSDKDYSPSISPTRSDGAKDPYLMKTDDKKTILKRRGKILELREVSKRALHRSPNSQEFMQNMED